MDWLPLDERGRLFARVGFERMDAHGLEQSGQLPDGCMLSPAAIGQQEVEAGVGMVLCELHNNEGLNQAGTAIGVPE
jgi:hypothetical protein